MGLTILILLHVLGACVWVGGHLLLLIRYLPEALANKDPEIIRKYEEKYETIGIPALLIQVITGILIGLQYDIRFFSFKTHIDLVFNLKSILLVITLILAIHARLFIIPKLNKNNLAVLAYHIIAISLLAVAFVYLGVSFRMGF